MESSQSSSHPDPRFELPEDRVKHESTSNSPRPSTADTAHHPTKQSSTPAPPETTKTGPLRKKGVASVVKKAPKRPKSAGPSKSKRVRSDLGDSTADDGSGDDEDGSDEGTYCICRGRDDHRWMICCEYCDDWFHGECIKLNKEIGENLIEKFVCPNCTSGDFTTIYKKVCTLPSCKKPARLVQQPPSAFCSNDHAQIWWERMISRLPKTKGKNGLSDLLAQDELMALVSSDLATVNNESGKWRLNTEPFTVDTSNDMDIDGPATETLSEEEKLYIEAAAIKRKQLEDESVLCHKMLTLIELAQERRRSAINAGKIGDDICGYDQRLDAASARDVFHAYYNSAEGQTVFETSKLGDPLGEDNETRGMCERKRCKTHSGWQKLLALGIKHQIREIDTQAAEFAREEKVVQDSAAERSRRRLAERNRVEILSE